MIYFGYTLILVTIGAILIGFVTGFLSLFFISRRQSILGDAVAHSTLAGITVAFILIKEQSRLGFITGALISSILAILCIYLITQHTQLNEDAAIGIVLSLFFGLGIIFLSFIQQTGIGNQANLEHYLFGNIAFLRIMDLINITLLCFSVILVIFLFWKELKLISFDPEYAKTLGLKVMYYELIVLLLVVMTIVIGVELIGVVMMAGLLIAPGIAARQWSNTFGRVVFIAGFMGALAGALGTILSANVENMPAGPTIIIVIAIITLFSFILGKNGIFAGRFKLLRYRIQFDVEETIEHLATHMLHNPRACDIREFDVKESYDDLPKSHKRNHKLYDDLEVLIQLGFVKPREGGNWILTHKGMQIVEKLRPKIKNIQGGLQ